MTCPCFVPDRDDVCEYCTEGRDTHTRRAVEGPYIDLNAKLTCSAPTILADEPLDDGEPSLMEWVQRGDNE